MALDADWQRKECRWRDLPGGKLLRDALDAQGLGSRKALAQRLGVSEKYIYNWTTGYRRPPPDLRPVLQKLHSIPVTAWQSREEQKRERSRRGILDAL